MSVYAISDLHLAFFTEKPMDVFGDHWEDHAIKIKENWTRTVKENDLVVLPGDTSWAMTLDEFLSDIMFIEELPGHKIISKGNHDYWWQTEKKLKEFKSSNRIETVTFLHNNAYIFEHEGKEYSICATRGWKCPGDTDFNQDDMKVYKRELQRLETSIQKGMNGEREMLVFIHYPPFNNKKEESGFTEILERYKIKKCFYGHLHGRMVHEKALIGKLDNESLTEYYLVSCDYLGFSPLKIL